MVEIERELTIEPREDGDCDYVIEPDHTIADVIRWLLRQGEDKLTLIQMIIQN